MSFAGLIRSFGAVALLSAVLLVIVSFLELTVFAGPLSEVAATGTYTVYAYVFLAAVVSLSLALVGLYFYQASAAGFLGLVGFLVSFVGTVLLAGFAWTNAFVAPYLAASAPEVLDAGPPPGITPTIIIFGVGWVLFGIATLRGRIYPRWASILLIVGAILAIVPIPLLGIVLAIAVGWLGFHLFTERDSTEAQQQSTRVR